MNAHVCHITAVHQARDPRIFYKECVSLARAGYDVTLLVANSPTMTLDDVHIEGVDAPFKGRWQRFRRVSQALFKRAIDLRADVYHFHDPEFLPHARKLANQGFRVIYDAHEDFPRQLAGKHYVPKGLAGFAGRAAERYEDRSVRQFTHVITATDHIRERFSRLNENVTTVRNFPRIEDLPTEIAPYAARAQELVYIGAITEKRGVLTMIDAMRDIDARLNLAGQFDSLTLHRQMKSRSWFVNKVKEWGPIGYRDIGKILAQSRVGLVLLHPLPSYRVALPVKLFDYMGHGLPVVASDFPLWREIVEGSNCGMCVDPLQPKTIAESVNALLAQEKVADDMGQRGRAAVLEKYNWKSEEATLLGVYKKVLAS